MRTILFSAAFLLCACPGGGNHGTGDDGGADANDIPPDEVNITVSGTASLHPDAVKYYNTNGRPLPSVAGLTLRVEEPLKAAFGDPAGYFGTVTLGDAGTFSVANVPSSQVTLGIAAGIFDPSCDGGTSTADAGTADGGAATCGVVVRSATSLYDVALNNGLKPRTDIVNTKAYAIPTPFHDVLTAAVTPARISTITGGVASSLVNAGFILGRIVDASGNPVAGATVVPSDTAVTSHFFYPSVDYSSVTQSGTSANGMFLYVHDASDTPHTFKITIDQHPEYVARNAGAAKGACLVLVVYPGTTAP